MQTRLLDKTGLTSPSSALARLRPATLRVERRIADGSIKRFFNTLTKPIRHGADKSFAAGCVGSGSFEDKGRIRNVKIWAPLTVKRKTESFPKAE